MNTVTRDSRYAYGIDGADYIKINMRKAGVSDDDIIGAMQRYLTMCMADADARVAKY